MQPAQGERDCLRFVAASQGDGSLLYQRDYVGTIDGDDGGHMLIMIAIMIQSKMEWWI